ncbi:EGF-like domain-containing protein [Ditylenchus destructor]|nr:EGF-like domain-containing protein [Ditylenchus destructor]
MGTIVVCSGNGYCECGKCSCNVAWTGATCSVPQSLPQEESTTHQQDHTTSSSSSEEGEKDDDNEPDATGEILPADQQGQDSREVDDENSPDGALAAKSTMWIVCAINTALVAVLGFWWFF